MTIASYRQETLARDLRNLRVEAGNIIFIHSSFRSLGSVIGGASAIIEAFKEKTIEEINSKNLSIGQNYDKFTY